VQVSIEHNMNIESSYHERIFAYLDLRDRDDGLCLVPHQDLLIEWQGNIVRLGVNQVAAPLTLKSLYTIMQYVEQSAVRRDAKLVWSFSSVVIEVGDLRTLLDRWDETREPPLLSIIALDMGAHRHTTRGLAAFVGYELAAKFDNAGQSRDAARNLTRLARHAIMNAGLSADTIYEAIDGSPLCLDWSGNQASPAMVTILL
jgi:hypothetical protein